jgi:hypothetical protein
LLRAAGLTVARIVPAGPTFSIIEAFARMPAQAATRQSTLP